MYKWLPLPDDHSQKGEIPASSLTRGWWTQAVLLGVNLIAEKNYYE